jgi:hypothetical protein
VEYYQRELRRNNYMSAIEKVIKEAVEKGGYKGANSVEFPTMDFGSVSLILNTGGKLHYWWSEIFLDPLFWQALGKARGWDKDKLFTYERETKWGSGKYVQATRMPNPRKNAYKAHWHRFIDHLAAGKDAESFFADLLK